MDRSVLALLRCPICAGPLQGAAAAIGCQRGHRFDVARQGYVNLLGGRRPAVPGDTAAMVQARLDIFAAGLFAPVAEAVATAAARVRAPGCIVDAGCGPGYYLRESVRSTGRLGIGADVSVPAVRRVGAGPGLAAVVADVWHGLPVADGAAAVVLDVFAPRNGADFARMLAPDGLLVVVTPAPDHLGELVDGLGLLAVEKDKQNRLTASLQPWFDEVEVSAVRWPLDLEPGQAATLAGMGPSAHHVSADDLATRAATRARWQVEASVLVHTFSPAGLDH